MGNHETFKPGIPCTQNLTQFKFYYQYRPTGNDTAECRVELLSNGTPVAGGVFKTNVPTGNSGWQLGTVNFTYVNALVPDTLYILFSASSLDDRPKAGSVLWIDDASWVGPLGVESMTEENNFSVFPNPSNGIFSIQHQAINSNAQTIDIYNLFGEIIYSTINNQASIDIDLSSCAKGVYFVKVGDGEKVSTEKIVVQ